MSFRKHTCDRIDDDDSVLIPDITTCGSCRRSWCFRCDPGPSALCPWCHGRGYSTAAIGKAQKGLR